MMLFGIVATLVWSLLHVWLGWRLIAPARLPPAAAIAAWSLLLLDVLVVPAGMILAFQTGHGPLAHAVQRVAFVGMGIVSILFAFVLVRDLAWWALRAIDLLLRAIADGGFLPADAEGLRVWLHRSGVVVAVFAAVVSVAGLIGGARAPRLAEERVALAGLPAAFEGYRVVQISDVHLGPTLGAAWLGEVVDRVNALEPDLVAVTGDLADGPVEVLGPAAAALGRIRARDGVVFVTGNHEYYQGVEPWTAFVRSLGIDVLLNEHRVVERDGARLVVAGVTDHRAGSLVPAHASDPVRALAGAPAGAPRLLLAHQPRSFPAAAAAGADLVLSGHTHGGQFFPWSAAIHLAEPYPAGLYRLGGSLLRVSRGTGHWGPPLRLGAPAEISLVVLSGAAGATRPSPP